MNDVDVGRIPKARLLDIVKCSWKLMLRGFLTYSIFGDRGEEGWSIVALRQAVFVGFGPK